MAKAGASQATDNAEGSGQLGASQDVMDDQVDETLDGDGEEEEEEVSSGNSGGTAGGDNHRLGGYDMSQGYTPELLRMQLAIQAINEWQSRELDLRKQGKSDEQIETERQIFEQNARLWIMQQLIDSQPEVREAALSRAIKHMGVDKEGIKAKDFLDAPNIDAARYAMTKVAAVLRKAKNSERREKGAEKVESGPKGGSSKGLNFDKMTESELYDRAFA